MEQFHCIESTICCKHRPKKDMIHGMESVSFYNIEWKQRARKHILKYGKHILKFGYQPNILEHVRKRERIPLMFWLYYCRV